MARPELSDRERQVLGYVANGRSNKEISKILVISENTVKAHVKSILTKLGAIGRTEAIAIAMQRGYIHSIAYPERSFFLRVTGGDVEKQKTLRFAPDQKRALVADMESADVIRREASWKQRIGTRVPNGLNEN